MKSTGLLKLVILGFVLAVFWLASAPGAEHPWDDDEYVACDSNNVLNDIPGNDDGTGLEDLDVIIIFSVPDFLKPYGITVFQVKIDRGSGIQKYKELRSSAANRKDLTDGLLKSRTVSKRR